MARLPPRQRETIAVWRVRRLLLVRREKAPRKALTACTSLRNFVRSDITQKHKRRTNHKRYNPEFPTIFLHPLIVRNLLRYERAHIALRNEPFRAMKGAKTRDKTSPFAARYEPFRSASCAPCARCGVNMCDRSFIVRVALRRCGGGVCGKNSSGRNAVQRLYARLMSKDDAETWYFP